MYDKDSDKEQEQLWLEGNQADRNMPIEKMAQLAVAGFYGCDEDCLSKKHCTHYSCECIRSVFPSLAHYNLYLKLRSYVLTAEMIVKVKGDSDD